LGEFETKVSESNGPCGPAPKPGAETYAGVGLVMLATLSVSSLPKRKESKSGSGSLALTYSIEEEPLATACTL
jgi:hypothetical protein